MIAARVTFEVLTLFPTAVRAFASAGLLGRAIERGYVAIETTDFRDFTDDRHRTVDDAPFGGGAGMVLKPEPVVAALEHVVASRGPVHRILLTPSGARFDQSAAERLAKVPRIALLCGRYEGIDDRVREHFVDECLSIGDFVLGGGEVAALTVIEAVSRLVDGVVGNPESVSQDSFSRAVGGVLLEFPQYTRPAVFRGHAVPEVLQSGDHGAITAWRLRASLSRTWALRPELRPHDTWPAQCPIHLALSGHHDDIDADKRWRVAARGLAGVAVVGGDADALAAWTRVFEGVVAVSGFSDVRALRRRFRSRDAWFVEIASEPRHDAAGSVAELLDRLQTCAGEQRQGLVLLAPGMSELAGDAVFAPKRATQHANSLAPESMIVDPSRPIAPEEWVERAIAALLGTLRNVVTP